MSPRSALIAARASSSPAAAWRWAPADRRDHLGVDVAVERQQARPLELHRERRERVGEHVVELARDPAALVERRRLVARQPRPLLLVEQFLRLDLVVLAQPQQVPITNMKM